MHADISQVVITTAEFRKGQQAARDDFARDPGMRPNAAILVRLPDEFRAGYTYEYREYLEHRAPKG